MAHHTVPASPNQHLGFMFVKAGVKVLFAHTSQLPMSSENRALACGQFPVIPGQKQVTKISDTLFNNSRVDQYRLVCSDIEV